MSNKALLSADPALKDAVTKQVAALRISGMSKEEIANKIRISRRQVDNVIKSDEYKVIITEIGESAVMEAKNVLKRRVSELVPQAYEALKNNLAEDNMEAVKVVFKAVGLEQKEESAQGDTSITILMPGQQEPKDVNADIEVEDETNT